MKNAFTDIRSSKDDDTLPNNLLAKLNDFTLMLFINSFHTVFSQAGKVVDVLQCELLDSTNSIQCVECYCKDEHNENSLRDTAAAAAAIEQADESDLPPRKTPRGAYINYKTASFEIINDILMFLREGFSGMQEFAFSNY